MLFTDILDEFYKSNHDNVPNIKKIFLGLCNDIERFFRLYVNKAYDFKIAEEHLSKFYEAFPLLRDLDLKEIQELLDVYRTIRNVSAHYTLYKDIVISELLEKELAIVFNPEYRVSIDAHLTFYGAFYVLNFIASKSFLDHFVDKYFHSNNFEEVSNNNIGSFQTNIKRTYNQLNSSKKADINAIEGLSSTQVLQLARLNKQALTDVFYTIEKCLLNSLEARKTNVSIEKLIRKDPMVGKNETLINKISKLRNSWFHGIYFGDVTLKNEIFTIKNVLNSLIYIKKEFKNHDKLKEACLDIDNYCVRFYEFFFLRLYELSCKILYKSLFEEEKFYKRLEKINNFTKSMIAPDNEIYELVANLYSKGSIHFKLDAHKFSDHVERSHMFSRIKILKITSKEEIYIGDSNTNLKEITIMDISATNEMQFTINGKSLKDINKNRKNNLNKNIIFYSSEV